MASNANFADFLINGYTLSNQGMSSDYGYNFDPKDVMPWNTGVKAANAGRSKPDMSMSGYVDTTPNGINAHTLLSNAKVDNSTDIEYLWMMALGQGKLAVPGDPCLFNGFTNQNYNGGDRSPSDVMQFDLKFGGRGRYAPLGYLLYKGLGTANISQIIDRSAYPFGSGLQFGAAFMVQVLTPMGVQATGSFGIGANAADGDTVVLNGTTYTAKTTLTPTANQFKIGSTALETMRNLYAMLVAGDGDGTKYASGSTAAPSTLLIAPPTTSSSTVGITYATTGVAGNAITLAITGSFTRSAATLTGGVAGETATITWGSAATSGGSYTTHATSLLDGTVRGADYIVVPSTATILPFWKFLVTRSANTQPLSIAAAAGVFWYGG